MRSILRNLFIMGILIGIIYGITNYNGVIQYEAAKLLHLSSSHVAGASTKVEDEKIGPEIGKEVAHGVEGVKKQALNVKVGDVISTLGRAEKIIHDAQSVTTYVKEQIQHLLKH